mmetsp:Transcript_23243/g.38518  ORF Transcript_23243/g.38518 Transcript_23243/m.38518 type:complete len:250 (-) Transcript_23243:180-929(-)
MMFSKALLALCAITQATAFVVQGPKAASATHQVLHAGAVNDALDLSAESTLVQGNSLRTFKEDTDRVQIVLKTDGRPLSSRVELWHGPNYNPMKVEIYLEDGGRTPFNCVMDTPYSNTVAVFNTGAIEFPLSTCVAPEVGEGLINIKQNLYDTGVVSTIQGGALKTYTFAPSVQRVQVALVTDSRHLQAKIEVLQGPNNIKQFVDIYSSDGKKRSFFAVFEIPEAGCVFRIVNKGPIEYPISAYLEPYP